ncbi:MAG: glycosyltransferase family 4 protein [Candidatus Thermoplasmatota archaeon]
MRIVHLNPFYFPYAGGIERRIRSVAQRLAARGHDVHIVTAQQPGSAEGKEMEGAVTVHRLPSRFPLKRFYNPPPVVTPEVATYVNALKPDVVDFHFRWSPSYNKAFRSLACAGKVITYHNTFGEGRGLLGLASRLNDRIYMATLRHARQVVCVSDRVRRDLASRGFPEERLVVNVNAVEKSEIAAMVGTPETPLPKPYAVAVGRMVAVKGFEVLVDAWPQVPDLDLVLVGKGPELEPLKRQAESRGVADRIHFPGWVSEEEKVRLLRAAFVYVHPARFESFPFSILEAMEAGAPLVCSGIGGIPEAVGDAGPLLGHDPVEWAAALRRLRTETGLRDGMAAASKARSAQFDWDRITTELEAVYRKAAASN